MLCARDARGPRQFKAAIRALGDIVADSRAQRRIAAQILAAFSALALILAAVGIYVVMSYSVTQRMHEIGIRIGLGAQRNDILRMIVGAGLLLAVIGVAVGLAMAYGLSRAMVSAAAGILVHVSNTDPPTYAPRRYCSRSLCCLRATSRRAAP